MNKCFTVAAVFLFLTSCGNETPEVELMTEPDQPVIGLAISMTEDSPFFSSLIEGAAECALIHHVEIRVVFADENAEVQSSQIRILAEEGISVLLLNPVNDNVIPAAEEVSAMGIPVITIDRGMNCEAVVTHIASDNRSGGVMAGEYLAEALHRNGRVVEIRGTEGSSAAAERGYGFNLAMAEYPDIEIIASINADFNREMAEEQFSQLLQRGIKIDGVFAHNDDMVLGAMDAARAAGYDEVLFIGFDATDEAVMAVENGDLMATIAQRPADMGHLGIETAVDLLDGQNVPDSITVDLAIILR